MATNNSSDYSPTNYSVQVGGLNGTLTNVSPSATLGVPLISQGAAANPTFGTAVVAGGGTGIVTTTAYGLIAGGTSATGNFQNTGTGAASSTVLIGNGAAALPSFSSTPQITGLGIGAASTGSGLTFDGSNTMSAYSLGTWAPTMVGGTVAGITTYSTAAGYYVRIGALVYVSCVIVISASTGSGDIVIGGLPFAVNNQAFYQPVGGSVLSASGPGFAWPAGTTTLSPQGIGGSTTVKIYASGTTNMGGYLQIASTNINLQFTLSYFI